MPDVAWLPQKKDTSHNYAKKIVASESPSSPILDPQIYQDQDDESDLRWKAPLESLINGSRTPLEAAQAMDSLLRAETSERLQQLVDFANIHYSTPEGRPDYCDWGGLPPPNASAITDDWFKHYCRVCTAFSPYSEGQNRLIRIVEELKGLPRWTAPESYPDEDGNAGQTEFWAIGFDKLRFENEFRRYHIEIKPGYYRDVAEHKRWRNFQHTMARLTANKLIYCSPFNELSEIKPGEPGRKLNLEHDIIAAAQWIIWPTECRYVYKECIKKETTIIYWHPWSKERWDFWKRELELVVDNVLYDEQTKSVARLAVQRMKDVEEEVEEEGSGGSDED